MTREVKKEFKELTDEELVKQITCQQDRRLIRLMQEELYMRHNDKVYGKCLLMTKDNSIARDLAHDIFIKIFLKLHTFKGNASFLSWTFAITYNHCISYLNRTKNKYKVGLEDQGFEIPDDEQALENKILKDMKLTQLEVVFEQLKDQEKLLLTMRYKDGFSIKQMSEILGVNSGALKMRLKRSRDHLANLINETSENEA